METILHRPFQACLLNHPRELISKRPLNVLVHTTLRAGLWARPLSCDGKHPWFNGERDVPGKLPANTRLHYRGVFYRIGNNHHQQFVNLAATKGSCIHFWTSSARNFSPTPLAYPHGHCISSLSVQRSECTPVGFRRFTNDTTSNRGPCRSPLSTADLVEKNGVGLPLCYSGIRNVIDAPGIDNRHTKGQRGPPLPRRPGEQLSNSTSDL